MPYLLLIISLIISYSSFAMEGQRPAYKIFFTKDKLSQIESEIYNTKMLLLENNSISLEDLIIEIIRDNKYYKFSHLAYFFILQGNKQLIENEKVNFDVRKENRIKYKSYFDACDRLFQKNILEIVKDVEQIAINHDWSDELKLEAITSILKGLKALAYAHSAQLVSCNKAYFLFEGEHHFIPDFQEEDRGKPFENACGNCAEPALLIEESQSNLLSVFASMLVGKRVEINHVFNILITKNFFTIIDGYSLRVICVLNIDMNNNNLLTTMGPEYFGPWQQYYFSRINTFRASKEINSLIVGDEKTMIDKYVKDVEKSIDKLKKFHELEDRDLHVLYEYIYRYRLMMIEMFLVTPSHWSVYWNTEHQRFDDYKRMMIKLIVETPDIDRAIKVQNKSPLVYLFELFGWLSKENNIAVINDNYIVLNISYNELQLKLRNNRKLWEGFCYFKPFFKCTK